MFVYRPHHSYFIIYHEVPWGPHHWRYSWSKQNGTEKLNISSIYHWKIPHGQIHVCFYFWCNTPSYASLRITTDDNFAAGIAWWRHQMESLFGLLAICAVPGVFPAQRPVTRNFGIFFDLHPNERLSKQWWGRWFETPSCPLRRHNNWVHERQAFNSLAGHRTITVKLIVRKQSPNVFLAHR